MATRPDKSNEMSAPDPSGPDLTGPNSMTGPNSPHFSLDDLQPSVAAWEEVEEGRFMPRRVRGSCHGRALG